MPFDPAKPVDDSLAEAVELRNQFNALKTLIDAQQNQIAQLEQQMAAFAPVLIANDAEMSLEWTYKGPPCAIFDVFIHDEGDPPGVFKIYANLAGNVRTWDTQLDDPADAVGTKYYIVPMDDDENALTPASNTVNFCAG